MSDPTVPPAQTSKSLDEILDALEKGSVSSPTTQSLTPPTPPIAPIVEAPTPQPEPVVQKAPPVAPATPVTETPSLKEEVAPMPAAAPVQVVKKAMKIPFGAIAGAFAIVVLIAGVVVGNALVKQRQERPRADVPAICTGGDVDCGKCLEAGVGFGSVCGRLQDGSIGWKPCEQVHACGNSSPGSCDPAENTVCPNGTRQCNPRCQGIGYPQGITCLITSQGTSVCGSDGANGPLEYFVGCGTNGQLDPANAATTACQNCYKEVESGAVRCRDESSSCGSKVTCKSPAGTPAGTPTGTPNPGVCGSCDAASIANQTDAPTRAFCQANGDKCAPLPGDGGKLVCSKAPWCDNQNPNTSVGGRAYCQDGNGPIYPLPGLTLKYDSFEVSDPWGKSVQPSTEVTDSNGYFMFASKQVYPFIARRAIEISGYNNGNPSANPPLHEEHPLKGYAGKTIAATGQKYENLTRGPDNITPLNCAGASGWVGKNDTVQINGKPSLCGPYYVQDQTFANAYIFDTDGTQAWTKGKYNAVWRFTNCSPTPVSTPSPGAPSCQAKTAYKDEASNTPGHYDLKTSIPVNGTVNPGDKIVYLISGKVLATPSASAVTWSDTLDANLTYVDGDVGVVYDNATRKVTATKTAASTTSNYNIAFRVQVAATVETDTTITNTATLTSGAVTSSCSTSVKTPPSPTSTPITEVPPMCVNITKNVATPVLGSSIIFSCTPKTLPSSEFAQFRYRISTTSTTPSPWMNLSFNANSSTRRDSLSLVVSKAGQYTVGCRICQGLAKPGIGIFAPAERVFHLRNTLTSGQADTVSPFDTIIPAGNTSYLPIAGDWNADGRTNGGVYDPATGFFYLRNSHASGNADTRILFDNPGRLPIAGDWDGDSKTDIGTYDATSGRFALRGNSDAEATSFVFGNPNMKPIAGDWNGDGTSTVGVFDPATRTFFLTNTNKSGVADETISLATSIPSTATASRLFPVAAQWDTNGVSEKTLVGVYDQAAAKMYLKLANGDVTTFTYGTADQGTVANQALPVAGSWNQLCSLW